MFTQNIGMMKIIGFFCVLVVFLSCDKVYNLEERYTVEAQVFDTDANPLPNINVEVYYGNIPYSYNFMEFENLNKGNFFPIWDNTELISFDETNENGEVQLHFPAPINGFTSLSMLYYDTDEAYKPFVIAANKSDFDNNHVFISGQQLYRYADLVRLNITTDLDESYQLLEYNLNGNIAYNSSKFDQLTAVRTFQFTQNFDVQKNQILEINYTLRAFNENETSTINEVAIIEIGEENIEYVIQNP